MTESKLFRRDFTLVVIGQIISLFGNAVLRYALPLYLLNETHSAALFGAVSACAFLPMIFFSPIGGLVADRVNKRDIMVALDFFTAAVVVLCALLLGKMSLPALLIAVLMLLYGISGAYQPAVQASIPLLAAEKNLNSANAVINMVSSLSGLLGPALGGVVFSVFGIMPVLYISAGCFLFSAVMEIFIRIPFEKREQPGGIFKTAKSDLSQGFRYISRDNPLLGRVGILLAAINCIFSALILVGLPVIITEGLDFPQAVANRLYGYAQAAMALGGLLGGIGAMLLGGRLRISKSYKLITACTATLIPMGLAVFLKSAPMTAYIIIVLSCVVMMFLSAIFSIQIMSYGQKVTPGALLGKVMAMMSCMVLCAHPLGQLIYGFLFEKLAGAEHWIFAGAFLICLGVSVISKRLISSVPEK